MTHGDTTLHGASGRGLAETSDLTGIDPGYGEEEHAHHPGDREYIRVAIILTIITAAEVAIYYVEGIRSFLVPVLIVLSVAKFVAVVGYFMHLKFDDRRFLLVFAGGLAISVSVIVALVIMFWTGAYVPELPAGPGVVPEH
ncbi:MAG: cytochrome C oxidase subunit IV family protein [Chloroflexota bacterium]|nr:cytochrome C oxidase subunit IV family protein [Chloroflexota bacterium]